MTTAGAGRPVEDLVVGVFGGSSGAFHHLSAVLLEDLSRPTIDGDVMVVGDDRAATDTVQALAGRLRRACAGSTPVGCATPARSRR